MSKQKKIIFLHLPKNGGSTFNSILRRNYSDNEIFGLQYNEEGDWNLKDFVALPQEKRDCFKLLYGHCNFGLHRYFTQEFRYITFIRHPVDRTISFYNYIKRQKKHRLLEAVKGKTLSECVTQIKDFDVVNGQARKISGVNDQKIMLEKALENVDRYFDFIGVQEFYDESLLLLQQKFSWNKIFYKKKNVGSKAKAEIDPKLIREIIELNKIDLELYTILREKFMKELRTVNHLALKKGLFQGINRMVAYL